MSVLTRPPVRLAREDVRRIATLARLQLTDTELDLFARQLTGILEYAGSLQSIDTADVPAYAGAGAADQLRDDVPVPSLTRDAALGNAPNADRDAGTFIVPKVIG